MDGKPEPLFQTSHENWARTCRGTYRSSGLFSDVRSDGEHADLSAAVEVSVDKTFSKEMALAWEFTLMLVPCTENYQFTVRTTFRDEVGHIRGAVEKHGTVVVWNEMLLMFVAPFSSPKGTEEAVLERLGRSTLLDAMEKGYVGP